MASDYLLGLKVDHRQWRFCTGKRYRIPRDYSAVKGENIGNRSLDCLAGSLGLEYDQVG